MNFGKCDRQITLLAPLPATQDGYGQPVPVAYEEKGTVWAEQKPGLGTETFIGEQQMPQQAVSWQLRYRADVKPTWRLRYHDTTYEITAVVEIGRRVGLTLTTYTRG